MEKHYETSDWYGSEAGKNRIAAWVKRVHKSPDFSENRREIFMELHKGNIKEAKEAFESFIVDDIQNADENGQSLHNLIKYGREDYGDDEIFDYLFSVVMGASAKVAEEEATPRGQVKEVGITQREIEEKPIKIKRKFKAPPSKNVRASIKGKSVSLKVETVVPKSGNPYVRTYSKKLGKYVPTPKSVKKKFSRGMKK